MIRPSNSIQQVEPQPYFHAYWTSKWTGLEPKEFHQVGKNNFRAKAFLSRFIDLLFNLASCNFLAWLLVAATKLTQEAAA
jgi:hypothetical protein